RVPFLAAFDGIETRHDLLRAVAIDAQNSRIVRADKNRIGGRYAAGKPEFAGGDSGPFAGRGWPIQGIAADDRENAAVSIGRQASNRAAPEFPMDGFSGDVEQSVFPGRNQDRWHWHGCSLQSEI